MSAATANLKGQLQITWCVRRSAWQRSRAREPVRAEAIVADVSLCAMASHRLTSARGRPGAPQCVARRAAACGS
jgi:hypothetical protein